MAFFSRRLDRRIAAYQHELLETIELPLALVLGEMEERGFLVDRAAIGTCAKRILEGAGTEGGQDLKRYDKYMKEAE